MLLPNERIGQRVPLIGIIGKISAYDQWEFNDKPEGLPVNFMVIDIIRPGPTEDGTPCLPTRCDFNDDAQVCFIAWYHDIEVGDLISIIGNCEGILDGVAVLTSCGILGSPD